VARDLGFRLIPTSADQADTCARRTTADAICYCAEATDEERDAHVLAAVALGLERRRQLAERGPPSSSRETGV
jgi:hypothetical protein